jgi:DNA-binding GntR family transcriptional regulator
MIANKPRYLQLKESLKRQILANVYKIGDSLPSENELCALNDLARSTVRQALGELEQEGYITKVTGKGSIVTARRRTLGLLSFKGFSEVAEETHQPVETKFISKPALTKWPEDFFFPLPELQQGAGCISLARVRLIGESPVMLEYTFVPNLNLTGLVKKPLLHHSLFETLSADYHIEVTGVEQDIRAIHAPAPQATHLEVPEGRALLHIYRKYLTSRPELNLYSSLYCNTEKYSMGNVVGS